MRRKDEIAEKLEGLSSICVHVMCRKSYTRESNIAAAINPPPRKVKTLRSSLLPFNFKLHCLFCGDKCDLSAEKKKPLDRRNIYEIRTTTCKQSICSASVARDDEWGHMVGARIEGVIDLVAAEAKYHNSCYVKFFKMPSNRKRGRPEDDDLAAAFDDLFAFLKENDECQYSVEELHEKLGEYLPACTSVCSEKNMRKKLVDHFGDDVIITSLHGRKPVVCFRDTGFKIINSSWYTQKSQDPAEERLRIVKTAAAIIREDIRSMAYITDAYAPADTAFDDTASVIPHTLNVFMDDVINKWKKGDDKGRKRAVINHAIISATRPRSFLSMIQVGLALYIHRHVGSRHLVDILFSMGICASYNEARLYEASAGEEFLLALYGAPKTTLSLNQHRHHCFMKAVAKCPSHSKIQLAALPPTSAAAKEHSLRVYHQVQHWLGCDLPQTDWGWDLVNGNLHPVLTRQPPAPDSLLNLITCNCKCGYERGCGCKKAGLKCSLLCGNCRGSGCSNSETPEEVSDDDSDDHTNVLQQENEDPSDLTQSDDSSDEDGIDLQEEDSSDSDDHSEVASAFSSTSTDRVKKHGSVNLPQNKLT